MVKQAGVPRENHWPYMENHIGENLIKLWWPQGEMEFAHLLTPRKIPPLPRFGLTTIPDTKQAVESDEAKSHLSQCKKYITHFQAAPSAVIVRIRVRQRNHLKIPYIPGHLQ